MSASELLLDPWFAEREPVHCVCRALPVGHKLADPVFCVNVYVVRDGVRSTLLSVALLKGEHSNTRDLMHAVSEQHGIPVEAQQWVFKGEMLPDCALRDVGVQRGSTLFMPLRCSPAAGNVM